MATATTSFPPTVSYSMSNFILVGDLRNALKDLPSRMKIRLAVVDAETKLKMEGHLDLQYTVPTRDSLELQLVAKANFCGLSS